MEYLVITTSSSGSGVARRRPRNTSGLQGWVAGVDFSYPVTKYPPMAWVLLEPTRDLNFVMSATTDPVYLATIAQYKLSIQAGRPAPSLRLLVGHSNLLGTLAPGLLDLWSLDPSQLQPEKQGDDAGTAGSKFTEKFTECSGGGNLDWDSSSDSDDDSAYSSDESYDGTEDDDNSQHAETDNDATELSLLDDHLAQLRRRLASRASAASTGSWLTAEFWRRRSEEKLSMQAPVVVSSENAMAETSTAPSAPIASPSCSPPSSPCFCLPPRNPGRVAEPGVLVSDQASFDASRPGEDTSRGGQEVFQQHQARVLCCCRPS